MAGRDYHVCGIETMDSVGRFFHFDLSVPLPSVAENFESRTGQEGTVCPDFRTFSG